MAKKVKLTRKQIKKPDEFVAWTTQFVEYCVQNAVSIFWGLGIAVVVVLISVGIFYYMHAKDQKAMELLATAEEIYRTPIINDPKDPTSALPHYQNPIEKYPKAIEEFTKVIETYPKSEAGIRAQLYIGNCYYEMARYDDASKAYQKFIEKAKPNTTLYWMGVVGLGYSLESEGKNTEAIAAFAKASGPESNGFRGEALFSLYRLKRRNNDINGAKEALKTYLEAFPQSPAKNLVESLYKQLAAVGPLEKKEG